MTPNKKRRGFRRITVDGAAYSWRGGGKITVQLANCSSNGSQLHVDYGWYDVWLYVNRPEDKPPDFDIHSETPSFVAAAIQFARGVGWRPETQTSNQKLYFRDEKFSDVFVGD